MCIRDRLKEQAMEEMLEEQYTDQDPDFLAALDNFAEERGEMCIRDRA